MMKRRLSKLPIAAVLLAIVWTTPVFAEELETAPLTGVEHASAPMDAQGVEPTGHAESSHEENVGFPQLDTSTYASQVFWLAVAFIALYTLMSRVALPRVGQTLEKRDTLRQSALDDAEKMNEDAQQVQNAYEASLKKAHAEASESLRMAEEESARIIAGETARFAQQARQKIEAAEKTIAQAKNEAMASIGDIAAEVAAEIASRVSGATVHKTEAHKAVLTVIKEG